MGGHKHCALHEPWHEKEDGNVFPSLMSIFLFYFFALDNPIIIIVCLQTSKLGNPSHSKLQGFQISWASLRHGQARCVTSGWKHE